PAVLAVFELTLGPGVVEEAAVDVDQAAADAGGDAGGAGEGGEKGGGVAADAVAGTHDLGGAAQGADVVRLPDPLPHPGADAAGDVGAVLLAAGQLPRLPPDLRVVRAQVGRVSQPGAARAERQEGRRGLRHATGADEVGR